MNKKFVYQVGNNKKVIDLWVIGQLYQLQNLRRVEDVSMLMILNLEVLECNVMFVLIDLIFWRSW